MPNDLEKIFGIVVALKANYLIVEVHLNQKSFADPKTIRSKDSLRLLCTIRKRLLYRGVAIGVGDRVAIEALELKSLRAVVSDVEPRRSFLKRPPVANATDVFVVLSFEQPSFDFDQASRFLLTAEQTGLSVHLILNKSDLVSQRQINTLVGKTTSWGYLPFVISLKNNNGIDPLLTRLKSSNLSVLCGPSGVGKSSLLKYILPDQPIVVGNLSRKLQKGKNTTRHVELFSLGKSSLVADTPGFNRPELQVGPNELLTLFPVLHSQLLDKQCKFRNCLHRDEPGCVVDKSSERYHYYRELIDEIINFRHPFQGG